MMAIETLSAEHAIIDQVLTCLQRLTEKADEQGRLWLEPAMEVMEFLQGFVAVIHFTKEENELFPLLEARGIRQLRQLRYEHKKTLQFLQGMSEAVVPASQGDVEALQRFHCLSRHLAQMQSAHIGYENELLFPLAQRVLLEEDLARLQGEFARIDHEYVTIGTHRKLLDLANSLAKRFGVEAAFSSAGEGFVCCCGVVHEP